jgi:hypothetical protein
MKLRIFVLFLFFEFGQAFFSNFLSPTRDDKLTSYVSYQPEQVHLALGETPDQMVVTWSTMEDPGESVVEYGINGMVQTEYGESKLFVDGGPEKHSQYIHKVVLKDLEVICLSD